MGVHSKFDFKSRFLFNDLTKSELKMVEDSKETLTFKTGDKLFYEDGVPTGVYELVSGRVKKYKTVLDDRQQIFYVYIEKDLFGYHALLSEERYQDSCEAIENVEVQFISKQRFLELLIAIPNLKNALLVNMAHEFGVLANIIGVLSQKSQNVRVALFLMVLQIRFKTIPLSEVGVDISREDLANIVGTSRESLSRSLNYLKNANLIKVERRRITVLNEQEIEKYILEV